MLCDTFQYVRERKIPRGTGKQPFPYYDKLSSVLDNIEQLLYHFYEEGKHIALKAKLLLKSSYVFCLTLLVNTVLLKDHQAVIFAMAPKLLRLILSKHCLAVLFNLVLSVPQMMLTSITLISWYYISPKLRVKPYLLIWFQSNLSSMKQLHYMNKFLVPSWSSLGYCIFLFPSSLEVLAISSCFWETEVN